ncbi:hypothetical protein R3W88_019912 [Solanum pinnatisectum]|uniref:GH3 middle domain-containing protein n=1 Tax=Solanum pinnatisectum TaxID=50273 RepID=A0AAV9KNH6_9SOLN|nr:hypothetical protein R3W88_019912 [Solanum pinnatisectum]
MPIVMYEEIQLDIHVLLMEIVLQFSHPIPSHLRSSAGERKLMPITQDELDQKQLQYSLLMPVMNLPYDPYNMYTSPNKVVLSVDSFQSMYSQMLCGLLKREQVLQLGAAFASGLLQAIHFLQLNWQQLAKDITYEILHHRVTDTSIRECISKILKPNHEFANTFLRSIITVVVTKGVYMMYASSECYFALNLNPMCKPSKVCYTIMPNMCYFEFMPHDSANSRDSPPGLVDLANVDMGKEYEIVITTYAGLCRYRVVLFESMHIFQTILCLDNNTNMVEYTSYADTKTIPGHYLMDYAISRGGFINQYKLLGVLIFTPIVELLDSRVISVQFKL